MIHSILPPTTCSNRVVVQEKHPTAHLHVLNVVQFRCQLVALNGAVGSSMLILEGQAPANRG